MGDHVPADSGCIRGVETKGEKVRGMSFAVVLSDSHARLHDALVSARLNTRSPYNAHLTSAKTSCESNQAHCVVCRIRHIRIIGTPPKVPRSVAAEFAVNQIYNMLIQ